jgi:hypothetical protein
MQGRTTGQGAWSNAVVSSDSLDDAGGLLGVVHCFPTRHPLPV